MDLYMYLVSYRHFWRVVKIDYSLVASRKLGISRFTANTVSKPVGSKLTKHRKLSKAPITQLVIT